MIILLQENLNSLILEEIRYDSTAMYPFIAQIPVYTWNLFLFQSNVF